MIRTTRFLSLFAVALLLTACAGMIPQEARYDLELTEVERPTNAQQRYGPPKITRGADSGGVYGYTFEDSLVQVIAVPMRTGIRLTITNLTDHSIKVNWDEAAIVGFDGASERVVHNGVTYATRTQPQPPTIIVRRGRVEDHIAPVTNWNCCQYGNSFSPMLPRLTFVTAQAGASLEQYNAEYAGKSLQMLLPLEIQGVTNEYVFTWKVTAVTAPYSGYVGRL
jgi:hypothetical protein